MQKLEEVIGTNEGQQQNDPKGNQKATHKKWLRKGVEGWIEKESTPIVRREMQDSPVDDDRCSQCDEKDRGVESGDIPGKRDGRASPPCEVNDEQGKGYCCETKDGYCW